MTLPVWFIDITVCLINCRWQTHQCPQATHFEMKGWPEAESNPPPRVRQITSLSAQPQEHQLDSTRAAWQAECLYKTSVKCKKLCLTLASQTGKESLFSVSRGFSKTGVGQSLQCTQTRQTLHFKRVSMCSEMPTCAPPHLWHITHNSRTQESKVKISYGGQSSSFQRQTPVYSSEQPAEGKVTPSC